MNNIQFATIETDDDFKKHAVQLKVFFDSLDKEKEFFSNLNMEFVKKYNFIIVAKDGDWIVGVAGVKTTHLFAHKTYVGVKKEYQRRGVGTSLIMKRNDEARKRYNFIILKIYPNNIASQKINRALGCKKIGRRFSEDYLLMSFNVWGLCTFHVLKAIMPAVNCMDHVFMRLKRRLLI